MKPSIPLTLLCLSFVASGAAPYVGVAVSDGLIRINGANAAGNATLFAGATVETAEVGSKLRLRDGTVLFLGPQTRGQVFGDRTVIERGSARLDASGAYRVEALSLRIGAGPLPTSGVVSIHGATVEVYGLEGRMLVANRTGQMVASVLPKQDRTFAAATQPGLSTVSGVLTHSAGAYRLTDEISNASIELRGTDLASKVGQRIRVSGAPLQGAAMGAGTSEVIQVASLGQPMGQPASFDGAPQVAGPGPGLNIVIIEGDGAINNIRQRTAREEIVQVEDDNHQPVAGAAVSFLLPSSGPSGTFANGSRLFTTMTDSKGQAVARFQPNDESGSFKIKVDAQSNGRSSTALISSANAMGALAGSAAGGSAAAGGGSAAGGSASGGTVVGIGTRTAVIGGVIVAVGIAFVSAASAAGFIFHNQSGTSISPSR